jgi:hypothetical protein
MLITNDDFSLWCVGVVFGVSVGSEDVADGGHTEIATLYMTVGKFLLNNRWEGILLDQLLYIQ